MNEPKRDPISDTLDALSPQRSTQNIFGTEFDDVLTCDPSKQGEPQFHESRAFPQEFLNELNPNAPAQSQPAQPAQSQPNQPQEVVLDVGDDITPQEAKFALATIRAQKTAERFFDKHKADYTPTPYNGALYDAWMKEQGVTGPEGMTEELLERGFEELHELFETSENAVQQAADLRSQQPKVVVLRQPAQAPEKPMSTGLPDRAPAQHGSGEPMSAEGLYAELSSLPIDSARARMTEILRQRAIQSGDRDAVSAQQRIDLQRRYHPSW